MAWWVSSRASIEEVRVFPGVGGRGVVNLLVLNRVAKLLHLVEELVHGFIL
jgi:hypothetical protein